MTNSGPVRHALILGGGLAGTLAASVASRLADTVTVVDRDHFPDEPGVRKGVPQARHTHAMVSGGILALEELMPGVAAELHEAGAQHLDIPGRYLALGPNGWFPRYDSGHYVVGCSRALLDWTLRARLAAATNVTYLEGTDVLGLTGDAERVTGAKLRDRATKEVSAVEADLVVDATGRGSSITDWLTAFGLPETPEVTVDPGIFYATRVFRAVEGVGENFPAVNIQGNPSARRVRATGMLLPIEDGLWSVTLSGAPGGHPPVDDEGFREFAAGLPHPVIAEAIAHAEPVGPVLGFAAHANRRRHFERLPSWPRGLVVLGDAQTTLNPIFGHGMAVAAKSAVVLRDGLVESGTAGTRAIQRAIGKTAEDAWMIATGEDLRYPQTTGKRGGAAAKLTYRLQDWLGRAGTTRRKVADAQMAVITLSAPAAELVKPAILLDARRAKPAPALTEPPFTPEEKAALARAGGGAAVPAAQRSEDVSS